MNEKENKFQDYVTFPRTFEKYAWYKPLIMLVIGAVLYFVFMFVLEEIFIAGYGVDVVNGVINGGYESLNTSDASVYFSYLSIAIFIPIIYIGSKIVRDRPFSSYSSSRGGWNWKLYLKCLSIAFGIYLAFFAVSILLDGESGANSQVSLMAMILSLILIPAQCIAEEHVFRGFLMQTLGSWFKNPVVAIIIQSVIFAYVHSYNDIGVISIGISGVIFGLLSWRTNGLEAASAIHSINNLMAFYIVALGLSSISSTLSFMDLVVDVLITSISAIAVYYICNKKGWFDEETPS